MVALGMDYVSLSSLTQRRSLAFGTRRKRKVSGERRKRLLISHAAKQF